MECVRRSVAGWLAEGGGGGEKGRKDRVEREEERRGSIFSVVVLMRWEGTRQRKLEHVTGGQKVAHELTHRSGVNAHSSSSFQTP